MHIILRTRMLCRTLYNCYSQHHVYTGTFRRHGQRNVNASSIKPWTVLVLCTLWWKSNISWYAHPCGYRGANRSCQFTRLNVKILHIYIDPGNHFMQRRGRITVIILRNDGGYIILARPIYSLKQLKRPLWLPSTCGNRVQGDDCTRWSIRGHHIRIGRTDPLSSPQPN